MQARRSGEHDSVLFFLFLSDLSIVGAQSRTSCDSFKSVSGGMINDHDVLQCIKKQQIFAKLLSAVTGLHTVLRRTAMKL